tara:strand:- start:164 stop:484 length:321 start_codon:yes stop_codon:yes gene_type:complete
MNKIKEYVYDIEEYSQDVRCYQITSTVKLTEDEVRSVYQESDVNITVESNLTGWCRSDLTGYIEWCDERFTDDEILKKIKIGCVFKGTEYGDDCQLDITGEFENDE